MTKDLRRLMLDPNLLPLPKRNLIRQIAAQSAALGMPCFLVGGFVRDMLLGRPVADFDVVVEGDAIKLGRLLVKAHGGKLTAHAKFKTATWFTADNEFLDLITARSETYSHPGALPAIKPSAIEDDLRRRDFTVNAMAVRIDGDHFGELLDPLGGRGDLSRGLIRVLHPRSFAEDPTRMLRAVRYEGRYGFKIEDGTLKLINDKARKVMSTLSGERLRHEFDLIFDEQDPAQMLSRAAELDLLKPVHSALKWDEEVNARFRMALSEGQKIDRIHLWAIWLMDLPFPEIKSIGKRLHFTAETSKCAQAASSIYRDLQTIAGMKPSQCVERLEGLPDEAVIAVSACIPRGRPRQALESYLSQWKDVSPFTTGHDLRARGVPPGPKYKTILRELRSAWLDGEVTSATEETARLEQLLSG
jgi:tRNA nucleotidyltransferase (CCA-adding enzyme)